MSLSFPECAAEVRMSASGIDMDVDGALFAELLAPGAPVAFCLLPRQNTSPGQLRRQLVSLGTAPSAHQLPSLWLAPARAV